MSNLLIYFLFLLEEDKMRILSIAYQLLILSVDYYLIDPLIDPLLNRRDLTYFHSLPEGRLDVKFSLPTGGMNLFLDWERRFRGIR